ncbi:MAG: hypothetical protein ABIJ08_00745 [Nanoarchaeota archaeon]
MDEEHKEHTEESKREDENMEEEKSKFDNEEKEEVKHKEHHKERHAPKKEGLKIKKSDIWKSATTILTILLIVSLYFNFKGPIGGGDVLSADMVGERSLNYINENLLQPGTEAKLVSVSEKNNLYNVKLDIGGRQFDSYATKDGVMLFPSSVDMTEALVQPEETTTQPTPEVEKSDKPVVELFVMSHCPFGTQAEKGIIPVAELMGDKIDFEIKYVNYAMHGEKEVREELRQYCIKTEQEDKFMPYLKCFLEADKSEECLGEVAVDKDKLTACEEAKDKEYKITEILADKESWGSNYPPFPIYEADNQKYDVRGSPTLVINGASVSSARSPAAYLATICAAFNEAPEECDETVSSASPSAGFGWEGASAATTASCG